METYRRSNKFRLRMGKTETKDLCNILRLFYTLCLDYSYTDIINRLIRARVTQSPCRFLAIEAYSA